MNRNTLAALSLTASLSLPLAACGSGGGTAQSPAPAASTPPAASGAPSGGVEDGVLTIAADINSEKKDNREGYLYSERRTGHVERRFSLEGVREDDITAKCEHGILTVTLPKMQAEAPKAARKIAIASGEEKTDAPAEENK